MNKHACSASCPCQQGKDQAIAEKVNAKALEQELVARVATQHVQALDVGRGTFTDKGLKLHHWHGSLTITDMTNAGKRGKKVRELRLIPDTHNDSLAERVIQHAISTIQHMGYDQAKSYLEGIQNSTQREGRNLFRLNEEQYRGVDVEPMGTKLELEKKFPDGTIVRIEASPQNFSVLHSWVINKDDPTKPSYGNRQDTHYGPVKKQDGAVFYAWLKENLSKAANMGIMDLRNLWKHLGVNFDYH